MKVSVEQSRIARKGPRVRAVPGNLCVWGKTVTAAASAQDSSKILENTTAIAPNSYILSNVWLKTDWETPQRRPKARLSGSW
eukprot:m.66829 g.66829  ORF g.66829 m.66829 type:complete len:82 (+) comp9833_c1_seq2:2277-2522(+)